MRGYKCLEQELDKVDLSKVLPLLIKCRNITAAVNMCSLKAIHADNCQIDGYE